ncbi:MAG: nucleoside kinase [Clostridium perfringens]|nr:nucleoside kinase [Clostridium perfringens]
MERLKIRINDRDIYVDKGARFCDLLDKNYKEDMLPIILVKFNNMYHELTDKITEEGILVWVRLNNSIAMRTYRRALQFVFIKATLDLFDECTITIQHSISTGLYGEIHKDIALNEEDIKLIKNRMKEIINKDILIEKCELKKEDAINMFKKYKMNDKVKLLKTLKNKTVKLYKIEDKYDYFYGNMAYSTGVLKYFDLEFYDPGFILNLPSEKSPTKINKFEDIPQLSKVFRETKKWVSILGVADVASLNEKIKGDEVQDIIGVSEALHEKKIAYIADMISNRGNVKIVLIAGPSSSGKTTFSKRLEIQLRVNGYKPLLISLDDYYVDRDKTPLDEHGNKDFESINALDLEFFNNQLKDLLDNKSVKIPKYNFKLGKREERNHYSNLMENGIIIIEGIHGLNPNLTYKIPNSNEFKIYISALTQLNLDNHNRISTTDIRKLRRIVRDFLSRGYGGEETLKMWPSIKRGEEKNIFKYQEEADVLFNSTLVYEIAVLKKYALEELKKITLKNNSEVYYEAKRLKNIINFFDEINKNMVPENSILREFIGGSCFYEY